MNCPPVLLLIFNRPEYTKRVFERIRTAQPNQLFIAADGPRLQHPDDVRLCESARSIVREVDWSCEVKTLFREENVGFHRAVTGGITWFFEHVEHGIILEDDCLPALEFFPFCDELLARYRNDTRIGMISGNNWQWKLYDPSLSYSFSKHGHIWGWASWKRAWEKYAALSPHMTPAELNLIKSNISENQLYANSWWKEAMASMQEPTLSWDYVWGVVRYANNFLIIRPKVNLVANIGFGEEATHTRGRARRQYVTTGQMHFPLVHPSIVAPDRIADRMLEEFRFPSNRLRRVLIKAYLTAKQMRSRANRFRNLLLTRPQ